jgi:hypothetical protein
MWKKEMPELAAGVSPVVEPGVPPGGKTPGSSRGGACPPRQAETHAVT